MNRRHVWARVAALLDLVIALLLLLALQIGSSDLKVVRQPGMRAHSLYALAPMRYLLLKLMVRLALALAAQIGALEIQLHL
jgi:hypothetical protein